MRQLFMDSSTNMLYMAIGDNGVLVESTYRIGKKDHAKHVVDRIDQLLKRKDLTINDIDRIYIGSGPGSYTGLRIIGMVAKMLAYTKNIELYEVSSLYFLASGYDYIVAPMIDARNNNVFSGIYDHDHTLVNDALRTTKDFQALAVQFNAKPVLINDVQYEVNIQNIMNMSTKVTEVHKFVPNYLRKTEAEQNL
ncbi:MAG: tRNA (adenosine(37)-N6)-threonylcarbamoyltransferase complex dimerization subunit type 1 TsaB [Acholeplasmataceae bacterium]|nr:tRNA (adenosine(37)-N6)-threonylcarbamoyltransferase complex dimerization subunit type 1 TsaB [Acholeplasmataceae bacterium]MDD4204082.1 tRNA (adenosine(37)-N6)-threonylcarbamoyltransferase complex dimerization subunit type 1 TsaB [Acholeplasmataceae bacterium]MDD4468824.1 tRNA (adenosine(37)-N6)-threonylcarbamoyltransferase complex dimerization subunit type 1 TsaB [Acholeplasmataceae bacterium]MDD4824263.1 tRNA (adenosine(37)-N6)-threonylcarbamoyltransferase complex dimerization subunit type